MKKASDSLYLDAPLLRPGGDFRNDHTLMPEMRVDGQKIMETRGVGKAEAMRLYWEDLKNFGYVR